MIRLNSGGRVVIGGVLIAWGIVTATLMSAAWPLMSLIPGVPLMFRLVRDAAGSRFRKLSKSAGVLLKQSRRDVCGIVGEYFVAGPREESTARVMESLRDAQHCKDLRGFAVGVADGAVGVRIVQIFYIEAVQFTSEQNVAQIQSMFGVMELKVSDESMRSAALDLLWNTGRWQVTERTTCEHSSNVWVVLHSLPISYLGMATILASVGLVDIDQMLPIHRGDLQSAGTPSSETAMVYAVSQCYLYLLEEISAVVGGLMGTAIMAVSLLGMWLCQYKTVTHTTWTAED